MARAWTSMVVASAVLAVASLRCAGASPSPASPSKLDDRQRRHQIEEAAARPGSTRLRKAALRSRLKAIAPLLTRCYEQARAHDPQISGVINTKLTIRNEPRLGMILSVTGFDTHGTLGQSRDFLACATTTFEAAVLPPIETRGSLDLTYPTTFAPLPPDNHDTAIVDQAAGAADHGRWSDALRDAEQGLELTSLDGTFRRRLIEIAGVAACHVKDEPKARHYFSLAAPQIEERLQRVCREAAAIDLVN